MSSEPQSPFSLLSRPNLGLLLGLIGVVSFGGTMPFNRLAVEALHPMFVTGGRAAVAGMIAAIALLVFSRTWPPRSLWPAIALSSLCLTLVFPACMAFAMVYAEASKGGVVLGLLPLATAVVSVWLWKDRPKPLFWCAAVMGSIVVLAYTLRDGTGGFDKGEWLLMGCIVTGALGYNLSAYASKTMKGWEVISWQLVMSLPLTIPIAFFYGPQAPASVPLYSWAAFAYVAVISQYLGFFAWYAGLAMGGVARVSQVQLLQTFVTLLFAIALNGEHVDMMTWAVALSVVFLIGVGKRYA